MFRDSDRKKNLTPPQFLHAFDNFKAFKGPRMFQMIRKMEQI